MDNTTRTLITAQLRALLLATNTERQVATARQVQARTDAVRHELVRMTGDADRRSRAIDRALRRLGGVPDVVTPVLGRLAAGIVVAPLPPESLAEAILHDLALEHALADRARYLKALASVADDEQLTSLAERLVAAHEKNTEWFTTVLAEDALGGPAALKATPAQAFVRATATAVTGPARLTADAVNKTVAKVQDVRGRVSEAADDLAERGAQASYEIKETLAAGRDAGLARAEQLAKADGDTARVRTLHRVRADVGALKASELPVPRYPSLTVAKAAAAIAEIDNAEDLNAVVGFEQAHKGRKGVLHAAEQRLAELARETLA